MTRANKIYAVLGRVAVALFVVAWLYQWTLDHLGTLASEISAQRAAGLAEPRELDVEGRFFTLLERYFFFLVGLPAVLLSIVIGVRAVRRDS